MSKSSENVKRWRKNTKSRIIESMGGKCQCCGYNKCHAALDFHHIDPQEKDFQLGSIRANPKAWPKIVEELRKCILVCRNCHSEIHFGGREMPKEAAKFDEKYLNYKLLTKEIGTPCPVCQKLKPSHNKFCSNICSGKARERVDWDNIPLLELIKTKNRVQIAEDLNISWTSVNKRLLKLGINLSI